MKTKRIFLLFGIVLGLVGPVLIGIAQSSPPGKPNPKFTVSFESDKIQIGKSINVDINLSSDSGYELSDVKLFIESPKSLEWYDHDNQDKKIETFPIALGSDSMSTPFKRKLSLQYKDSDEKELPVTFKVEYILKKENTTLIGSTAYEKNLEIGKSISDKLLGVDNIYGIPIAFASFILPGLVCYSILQLFKVKYILEMMHESKILFSILVSGSIIIFFWIFKLIINSVFPKFHDLIEKDNFLHLVFLISLGILSGVIASIIDRCRKKKKEKFEEKNRIDPNDSNEDIIRKILTLNPKYEGNAVSFQHKDGAEYVGSHYAKTIDGNIYLVGSFQIDFDEFISSGELKKSEYGYDPDKEELEQDSGKILKLLNKIEEMKNNNSKSKKEGETGISIKVRDFIKIKQINEKNELIPKPFYILDLNSLRSVEPSRVHGTKTKLLVLA